MNQALLDLADYLSAALAQDIVSAKVTRDELVIEARIGSVVKVL